MKFAEKTLAVFKLKGFSEADIQEAKEAINKAWNNPPLKQMWINWIDTEYERLNRTDV